MCYFSILLGYNFNISSSCNFDISSSCKSLWLKQHLILIQIYLLSTKLRCCVVWPNLYVEGGRPLFEIIEILIGCFSLRMILTGLATKLLLLLEESNFLYTLTKTWWHLLSIPSVPNNSLLWGIQPLKEMHNKCIHTD
ncbi:unnamed protein product [Ilex paraguariensis]|uniref:Uncharacterized protein n=1 Tax=Ilex paraguariensis TaxID=185542 RepID=A0ABC8UL80_9AQUA